MVRKLFIFDMDGTLLRDTCANLEIAKILKKLEPMQALEQSYEEGLIDEMQFKQKLAQIFGVIKNDVLNQAFEAASKMTDIEYVVEHIKSEGDIPCLISLSPIAFTRKFARFGFELIYGSSYPLDRVHHIAYANTPEDKLKIVNIVRAQYGIHLKDCIAFGDSFTDLEIFKKLEVTMSINGSPEFESYAKFTYSGASLLEPYEKVLEVIN